MAPPEYGWAWVKWRAGRSLRTLGLLTLGSGAAAVWVARRRTRAAAELPEDGFILELDLESQEVVEEPPPKGLQALLAQQGRRPLQLAAAVDALRAAGGDGRVKGLFALIGQHGMGLAQIQELRNAVGEFK